MKTGEFLAKLMKELLESGSALAMYNVDAEEFSIVPKNEYSLNYNETKSKPKLDINIKAEDCDYAIVDKNGRVGYAEMTDGSTIVMGQHIKPKSIPKWKVDPFPYMGKNISITGDVTKKINTSYLKKLIRKAGGNIKSSVGPTTNLLIVGELSADSVKLTKAKEYGVDCVYFNDFLQNIGYEDRRQKPAEPAYINHARPSQRAAAEKAVGMPTYSDERSKDDELNWFSSEDLLRMLPLGCNLETAMRSLGKTVNDIKWLQQLGRGKRLTSSELKAKERIEYRANIRPDGSADIFKYVNCVLNNNYHIKKALLDGCKDLDGEGYEGMAKWSYCDSYARIALENRFGKELVELCREYIVSKL